MKIYKTIEHDKYRVTVESLGNGQFCATFNYSHGYESDRDIYPFKTLADAYEKALDIVAEENILKVYNHGL